MVAKNDVTGDSIQTKVTSKAYLDNYDTVFGKKDFKITQKSVTELNWDGNEDRGRYGEDESKQDEVSSGTV
tara:strand:- start:430 stop:642 length:213 start_codon:yes stop_codon:yes gene_type:complete